MRLSVLVVAAAAVALLACCLVSATATTAASSVRYFVLIDGGSTGSRAHVHQYTHDKGRPLPIVDESTNKKIKPGLSSHAKEPPGVSASIQDLLEFVRATVPRDQWTTTPIHVQATAGLRSVTPAEAHAVLEVVRDDLEASGFLFHRSWARIISGEQEGINGWLAVNYLLGVFDTPVAASAASPPSTGVVEMGGSSMQITFAPASPTAEDRKQLMEIVVAGHSYWLYTHSFLQYGLQAAEKLYQRLAITEIETSGNPCYPRAFRHSSVGDFGRCTDLLSVVIDKSATCAAKSCSFNGVYQPKIASEKFVAIENFYYTAQFFGTDKELDQTAKDLTPVDASPTGNQLTRGLRVKGAEFCNKPWSSLVEEYAKTPAAELSAFCFSAAYQSVVLESGLGFHPKANLHVAKTINGKGIDWEMGATIFELLRSSDPKAAADLDTPAQDMNKAATSGATSSTRNAPLSVRPHSDESGFCQSCLVYTVLFGVGVVLTYLAYNRYAKRQGAPMTSYSQIAFNRV